MDIAFRHVIFVIDILTSFERLKSLTSKLERSILRIGLTFDIDWKIFVAVVRAYEHVRLSCYLIRSKIYHNTIFCYLILLPNTTFYIRASSITFDEANFWGDFETKCGVQTACVRWQHHSIVLAASYLHHLVNIDTSSAWYSLTSSAWYSYRHVLRHVQLDLWQSRNPPPLNLSSLLLLLWEIGEFGESLKSDLVLCWEDGRFRRSSDTRLSFFFQFSDARRCDGSSRRTARCLLITQAGCRVVADLVLQVASQDGAVLQCQSRRTECSWGMCGPVMILADCRNRTIGAGSRTNFACSSPFGLGGLSTGQVTCASSHWGEKSSWADEVLTQSSKVAWELIDKEIEGATILIGL